jgi:uroporphyrinogen-III synthase
MEEPQRRILSTRQLPQQLLDKAASVGIIIDCIPFIATSPIITEALTEELHRIAQNAHHVVFTSAKAVKSVADRLNEIPSQWIIHCISGATLKEVHDWFPGVIVADTADDAASLALSIKSRGDVQSVVFFCGDKSLGALEEILEPGIAVKKVTVYRTRLTPVQVSQDYDALLFFSPSAIESYLSLNHIHPDTVVYTIGKTTAAPLENYSNKIIICHTPDANSMVQQVMEYYKASRSL